MKVGDKVMCIKDFIRNKYNYKFEKNKIYVIEYVDQYKIRINVDQNYQHNNRTKIIASAYFWLELDDFIPDLLQYYFFNYFINNTQIRRLKLERLKMCNDEGR